VCSNGQGWEAGSSLQMHRFFLVNGYCHMLPNVQALGNGTAGIQVTIPSHTTMPYGGMAELLIGEMK